MQRVFIVLSEYGYWGEELIGPKETLEKAGYILDYVTPTGKRPHALPPSMDASYVDPPLGKPVVSEEMAGKVKELEESDILDHPLSLKELFPLDRSYMSSSNYLRSFEEYNRNIETTVGQNGEFHENVGKTISAIVDYPFITGRSTADSYKTGELLVSVMRDGLKRYGW